MFVIIASVLLLSTASKVWSGVCKDGKVARLTESKGQLASPDEGESGACTWVINVPRDQRIIFYFEAFNIVGPYDDTYTGRECGDQETLIKLKDSLNDWPWKTYCQSSKPQPIATNKSSLTVEFKLSSKGDSKSWFTAEYTTLPFETKIDLRESPSAEISSPMFPGRYPRNSYFKWAVVAPSGFRIKIEFTKLGIQGYGIECQPDAVIVRDGPSVQSELIIKICGTRQNKEVHSSGNSMTIEFVSEVRSSDEDYIGFKATVSKEAKLYLILVPCVIGILLVSFIVGAILFMCRRRRSSSSAGNPRMQMSLLNDDDHMSTTQMSDVDPPNEANLPVYRPTTQTIKS